VSRFSTLLALLLLQLAVGCANSSKCMRNSDCTRGACVSGICVELSTSNEADASDTVVDAGLD
jgi:hypothetical protein